MARQETPDSSARPPEMIVTSITVLDLPQARGRPLASRLRGTPAGGRAWLAVAAAVGLAAVAAGIMLLAAGGHRSHALQPSDRAAIAQALGHPFPLRCLRIAVFPDDPDYAIAEIDPTSRCTAHRGYVSATLHRTNGAWRLTLNEGQLYVPTLGVPTVGRRGVNYPLGCLSAATLAQVPSFARAGLDRGVCARPH